MNYNNMSKSEIQIEIDKAIKNKDLKKVKEISYYLTESLFSDKKLPEIENDGDAISQSQIFNNTKYVKKWYTYWDTLSTDINYTNNWKLGDTVEISSEHEHGNKKGKICLGFSKDPQILCVKFKDGKKELINKDYIKKISIFDYLEDK